MEDDTQFTWCQHSAMATVFMKYPFLMNNLDYYNTAVYPWNSHWGGRKPTALFTYHLSLWMWWLKANVAYNARQSACVETELVSHWVKLHTIWLTQSWWYIFTYWPKSAAWCWDFWVNGRKKEKKKNTTKNPPVNHDNVRVSFSFSLKNITMSVSLLV